MLSAAEFNTIYKATFTKIYKYFYYRFVRQGNIEDLVQEVYTRFYAGRSNSSEKLSPTDYLKLLYGYARNVYLEWYRKQKQISYISFDEKLGGFLHEEDIPELALLAEEDSTKADLEAELNSYRSLLAKAMERLNPTVKEVLQRRFYKNETRKQVAAAMGCSEADVHTYQKRGIKYLSKFVGELYAANHK